MKFRKLNLVLFLVLSSVLILALTACQGQTTTPPSLTNMPVTPAPTYSSINPNTPSAAPAVNKEITVFAGSASKPPLDEAAKIFEKQTGIKVYITYGGSGTVLSQMELSKSGDVYIPGSPDFMIKAETKKIIDPATTKIIAYLIPAIAVQHGNPSHIASLSDLAKPGIKVGIGNPSSVCVGLYAIEILEYNHLLAEVNKNIITQAPSCDATATLISLKLDDINAVMGWDVFHFWDPAKIDVVYLKPEQTPRIAYIPAAISTFTKDSESSTEFVNFLVSKPAMDIFSKWGYNVTEGDARQFAPNAQIGGVYTLPAEYAPLVK
jgi:molybdate transport system substrate-binding protein